MFAKAAYCNVSKLFQRSIAQANKQVQQPTDIHNTLVPVAINRYERNSMFYLHFSHIHLFNPPSSGFFVFIYEETDDQTIDINVSIELFK